MNIKKSILIGSLPFDNEKEAMKMSLDILGDSLISLPDGEIGEKTDEYPTGTRAAWIMTAINRCKLDSERWRVIKKRGNVAESGYPADYKDVEQLKPLVSPKEISNYINFGYDEYFSTSYPIFKELKEKYKNSKVKFTLGVPTGLGITFATMNPITSLRYSEVFNGRIAKEVNNAILKADDDLLVQIEIPGELKMATLLPSLIIGLSTRGIFSLIRRFDINVEIGLHICLGDLNNIALIKAKNLKKLVRFTNHIIKHWPSGYKLNYIHIPLAEAKKPPTTNADFYQPLKDIKLPPGVTFVAGFAHEGNTDEDNVKIYNTIQSLREDDVAISHSCGLGRRNREEATNALKTLKYIVEN
tara:strand:+ start:108 stop:1178 length:1071 start_codon:yes stop_codon:yes gene_type:complete